MVIKINEAELEASFYEEKFARKYEKAMKRLSQDAEKAQKAKGAAEQIRDLCLAIRSCLNYLFSPGTAEKLLGTKLDLGEHVEAIAQLQAEKARQDAELGAKIARFENLTKGFSHELSD